jgi:hypothetical protein
MKELKEPTIIAGYTAPEVDAALLRGELDARANAAVSVLRRNPDWLDKGVMDFHAIMEIPKGVKHPRLGHLPEIETFVKTEREKSSSIYGGFFGRWVRRTSYRPAHPRIESIFSWRRCAARSTMVNFTASF